MNIGIICGGFTSEFEISLKSGATIARNLPAPYVAYRIVLKKDNCNAIIDEVEYPFDLASGSFEKDGRRIKMDAFIIYTHGDPGENGKVQAMFDIYGHKYVNSSALASELSFDKWFCNQFIKGFGINVAASKLLLEGQVFDDEQIVAELGLPLFVKPCDSGSSFGISKVNRKEDLADAIHKAFAEGDSVVIESFLDGTEVTCGVYRTKDGLFALPLAEIVSETEFFDYEAKYLGKSQEIVPARISEEHTLAVQEVAKKVYQIIRLNSVARIDFMLVKGVPYVIEVNTTPGFTDESIVPRMLRSENVAISDFWKGILDYNLA